jgi:hypothetical protein
MSEEVNKAYYAVIPANVRYDTELPPNAKLLYGEITALCNQNGYCWATNEYFASLYKCTRQSVSSWIAKLKERGYIDIELIYREGSKEILHRYIKIIEYPIQKNLNTPIQKNLKDNNTSSFNNTSNKKKERKKEKQTSYDEILSVIEYDGLRDLYYEYIKMRKLIKAPMTDRALKTLIKKVNELEPVDIIRQKKLLENAIINNWKSVYPLKDEEEQKKPCKYETALNRAQAQKLDELRQMYGG